MTFFLQSVFCICILYFAQSVFAIKYSLQNQFQSTISTRYCVDDDYDDSGGRTQRDCLSLTAPDRRVSLTEAKTNTVCTWHW